MSLLAKACSELSLSLTGLPQEIKHMYTINISTTGIRIRATSMNKIKGCLLSTMLLSTSYPSYKSIRPDTDQRFRLIVLDPSVDKLSLGPAITALLESGEATLVDALPVTLKYEHLNRHLALSRVLPEPPSAYETVGHIAHLNLHEGDHRRYRFFIGAVLLDFDRKIKTVVNKSTSIEDTFRVCPIELIAGEANYITVVRQGGLRFRLDYSAVYWNSRLSEEHEYVAKRIADYLARHKPSKVDRGIIIDATGGVGPYSILLAKRFHVDRIICNDLNPKSYEYMKENTVLNGVSARITCTNLDAADLLKDKLTSTSVEAIILNLPALSIQFLESVSAVLPSITYPPKFYIECFSRVEDYALDVVLRCFAALYKQEFDAFLSQMDIERANREYCKDTTDTILQAIPPGLTTQLSECLFDEFCARRVRLVSPSKWMVCCEFRLKLCVHWDHLPRKHAALQQKLKK